MCRGFKKSLDRMCGSQESSKGSAVEPQRHRNAAWAGLPCRRWDPLFSEALKLRLTPWSAAGARLLMEMLKKWHSTGVHAVAKGLPFSVGARVQMWPTMHPRKAVHQVGLEVCVMDHTHSGTEAALVRQLAVQVPAPLASQGCTSLWPALGTTLLGHLSQDRQLQAVPFGTLPTA